MPFNGLGTYYPPTPEYPATSGDVILASDFNTIVADIAEALSDCVTRDGQAAWTAALPTGGFGLTGLGGTAASPALRWNSADGFYSTGAGDMSVTVNGTRVGGWSSLGYVGTIQNSTLTNCTYTGTHDFTTVEMLFETQAVTDNSTKAATTAFVQDYFTASVTPDSISEAVNDSAYLYLASNYV